MKMMMRMMRMEMMMMMLVVNMVESGVEAKAAKSLLIHKYCRRHTSTFLLMYLLWKYKNETIRCKRLYELQILSEAYIFFPPVSCKKIQIPIQLKIQTKIQNTKDGNENMIQKMLLEAYIYFPPHVSWVKIQIPIQLRKKNTDKKYKRCKCE